MKRQPVESSNIKSVGYDEQGKVLQIEFTSGAVYQYSDVPVHTYVELMNWPSKGMYFARHIRDRYKHEKIEGAETA